MAVIDFIASFLSVCVCLSLSHIYILPAPLLHNTAGKSASPNGHAAGGSSSATSSAAPDAAAASDSMTPEERAVLEAHMARMEEALTQELRALQEQEVDLYVNRFEEAMALQRKLEEIEEAMNRQNHEVLLHQRILEIEAQEAKRHPEPEDNRATAAAGDDAFTLAMKAEGLQHRTADGRERRLKAR